MCLYGKEALNKRYTKTEKNQGQIPEMKDGRVKYIEYKCGRCIECKKQYARGWQIRLLEDVRAFKNGKFITLTFSDEWLYKLDREINEEIHGYQRDNAIATMATRLFLERWRKEKGKSIRHWLITELGHEGTENIHLHGIIWTNEPFEDVRRIWKYGFVWPRPEEVKKNYVNEATVNYITKYITKIDEDHKYYKGKVLTSPGIGATYLSRTDSNKNKFKEGSNERTDETYRTRTGHKIGLPPYWRNKLYNSDEKEILWLQKLDKGLKWVMGEKVDITKGMSDYEETIKWHRKFNEELGYGSDKIDEKQLEEETKKRKEMRIIRINRNKNPSPGGS